jgi:Outer membrane protein beta-barrel domain
MKKLLALFAFVALLSLPTFAQGTPALEVGGGYQFRSFDQPFAARLNENGGFFTADFNLNRWLGAAGEVDATRIDQGVNGTWDDYGFMFGPQIYPIGHQRLTPFVHVLFGASHVRVSAPAAGGSPALLETDTAFSYEGGGGLDWYFGRHVGIRLAEFDYERQYFFGGGSNGNPVQNNFKFSAGIVFRLGGR